MNKLGILTRTYKSIVVQKGALSLFFLYFWLTKFLSFREQHGEFLNRLATILAPYEFIHQETVAHDHLFMKRHA
jgi:hypothetical protein